MENNKNNYQYITAVDVGTTKIVCLLARRDQEGLVEYVDFTEEKSDGMRRGEPINVQKVGKIIREAMDRLEGRNNVKVKDVVVGIAGEHIKVKEIAIPRVRVNKDEAFDAKSFVTQEDLDWLMQQAFKSAEIEGEEVLSVEIQSYNVDKELGLKDPIGVRGRVVTGNFRLIIAKTDAVLNIKNAVEEAGLNPIKIELEPIASAYATLNPDDFECGVMVLDIGGGTSDVAIFKDNSFKYASIIPIAGQTITKHIASVCSITEAYAENVKCREEVSALVDLVENVVFTIPLSIPVTISAKKVSESIQATLDEMSNKLIHLLDDIIADPSMTSNGLVLTGGSSQIPHLVDYFKWTLGLEVRLVYPKNIKTIHDESLENPSYSTIVGLVKVAYKHYDENRIPYDSVVVKPEYQPVKVEEPVLDVVEPESEPAPEVKPAAPKKTIRQRIGDFFSGMSNSLFGDPLDK